MDDKVLLTKCILLTYREQQLGLAGESQDLIKSCIETIKTPDATTSYGIDKDIVAGLKSFCQQAMDPRNQESNDKETMLEELAVVCAEDDRVYDMFNKALHREMAAADIKRSIGQYKHSLNMFLQDAKIMDLFSQTFHKLRYNKDKIKDRDVFLEEFRLKFDQLSASVQAKDPAVMAEINLGNHVEVSALINDAKKLLDGTCTLKLGKKGLNIMTQGGLRRPSFTTVNAMQHNFKSGFTMELMREIAFNNDAIPDTPGKRPTLVRISFEDELPNNLVTMYEYIKNARGEDPTGVENLSNEAVAEYIHTEMSKTGYELIFMRVDPSQWTFKSIFKKVLEWEADGHEIHLLILDYLSHIPTAGCETSGAMGTDLRDLFRRVRNFGATKKMAIVTPHQIAPDANNLLRVGVTPANFVKEIYDKAYYSGSKQLGQEPDLEFFIHIVEYNGKSYLAVQRGKHRGVKYISQEKRYLLLPFDGVYAPKDDVGTDRNNYYRKLGDIPNDANTPAFSF